MKIRRRNLMLATVAGAGTMLLQACGGGDDDSSPPALLARNIVQVASANPDFSVLVSAVVKANLTTTLSGTDLFTVFAPTNAAFNAAARALGLADGAALVAALPASELAKILVYHVSAGRKLASGLTSGALPTAYVFEGVPASVTLSLTSGVTIADALLTQASVVIADVAASNGVIHAIDKLLVPPGVLNIVQMAQLNPVLSSLVGAVVTAGLASTLSAAPPPLLTVFAPVNDAFAAIQSTVNGLSGMQLQTVLTYHVLGTQVLAASIPFGAPVTTLAAESITINNNATPPAIATITDTTPTAASIVAVDIRASNGVIHVINKVLLPTL
jgi:transforming growth factor-beta-induced protein